MRCPPCPLRQSAPLYKHNHRHPSPENPTPASQSPMQTADSGIVLLEGTCIWALLTNKINTSAIHTHKVGIFTWILRPHSKVPTWILFKCPQTLNHIHTHFSTSIKTKNRGNQYIIRSHHPCCPPSSYSCISRLWTTPSLPPHSPSSPPSYPILNRISRPQKNFLLMRLFPPPSHLFPLIPILITHLWSWKARLNSEP